MKKIYLLIGMILFSGSLFPLVSSAAANNMTTITVDAEDYESGGLMYAIDSDDPSAFTTSNEFVVEAGSSHTVYVKDAAGNISGQVITAPIEKVGIEVTIGGDGTDSAVGTVETGRVTEPAEAGGGSLQEKTVTDGSSSSEKIFYTITTPNENVFYMVIDNTRTADNVYLLNQVTEEDLLSFVSGADAKKTEEAPIFSMDTVDEKKEPLEPENEKIEEKKRSDLPVILLMIAVAGGIYYYLKVYRPKKEQEMDLADAMDIEDFETEDTEDEEIVFEEDEKEKLLQKIIARAKDDESGGRMQEGLEEELIRENQDYINMELQDIAENSARTEEMTDASADEDMEEE